MAATRRWPSLCCPARGQGPCTQKPWGTFDSMERAGTAPEAGPRVDSQ